VPHNTSTKEVTPCALIQMSNLWEGIVIGFAMLKVKTYPNSLNTIVIPFSPGMSRNQLAPSILKD